MWGKKLQMFLLYVVLIFFAMLVLMPFFWMILTAFKQPGQALKIAFWPRTVISTNALSVSEYDYTGKTGVLFEYDDPSAASVSVAGSFNGWNKDANRLTNSGNGIYKNFIPVPAGSYEYKFVVNGGEWKTDPANSRQKNGNSLITVPEGKVVSNKRLSSDIRYLNGKLHLSFYGPNTLSMWVMANGVKHALTKNAKGQWIGEFSADAAGKFKIYKKRKFAAALKEMYTSSNFVKVIKNKDFPFGRFFLNSLIVATGAALLTVIICTMGGYAFAKKEFWLRDEIFWVLFATMLIPGMIYMVPQFAIVTKLRWINTYQGMIVPHLANIFGLYLMKQYIETIPNSLFESARIDGASEWQIFIKIVVPLAVPVMVTLFLLVFLFQWSNFLWQLIVNTPDSPLRTLPVGLALFKGQYGVKWEMMMAGASFSIIPITLLFLFAQRFFIEGITGGAVKE